MLVLVTPWVPLRYCCGSNVGFKVMLAAKGTNHKQKATPQGVLRHSQSQNRLNPYNELFAVPLITLYTSLCFCDCSKCTYQKLIVITYVFFIVSRSCQT